MVYYGREVIYIMLDTSKLMPKVFLWMFVGLFVSFGTGYYVSVHPNMVYNLFSGYTFLFLFLIELGVAIFFAARIRKMKPMTAIISYLLYSFITGLTLSGIFLAYSMLSILTIFGVTSIIFMIFAILGYVTKIDLTKFGTYLFMALLGIIIVTLINLFLNNTMIDLIVSIVGIIIFIGFIAYDVQTVKNNLYEIGEETNLAVYGAFQLYLDFINIFLDLIHLFGDSD